MRDHVRVINTCFAVAACLQNDDTCFGHIAIFDPDNSTFHPKMSFLDRER